MSRVPLIFGTMTIGDAGKDGVRTSDKDESQQILDVYFGQGHGTELDTARQYGEGTTEAYLSTLNLHGAALDTKVYPVQPGAHSAANLRKTFELSLEKLKVAKVRTLYLHAPDRSVDFAETLQEADKLHKEGKFEQLGLSNYTAWEVAEIVATARERGLLVPRIYQAMYNAMTRAIEEELVPCLRKYGIRLVVYNPLAGGLLTGKVARPTPSAADEKQAIEQGSRFDVGAGSGRIAKMYQGRYFKKAYFDAIERQLKPLVEGKHGLTLVEVALRWLQHHSVLKETDGVILGASSAKQVSPEPHQGTPFLSLWIC